MLSEKHAELLNNLDITKLNINIVIDAPLKETTHELVIDIEHDENGTFVCCGVLPVGSATCYIYFDFDCLRSVFNNESRIIGHNVKSDVELLRQWGIDVKDEQIIWDTQLYHHLLDSSLPEFGLKYLADKFLDLRYSSYDDIVGKRTKKQSCERITLDKQPRELVTAYNAHDCYATEKLRQYQAKLVKPVDKRLYEEIEQPVALIFAAMESRGIRIDREYLKTVKEELETQIAPVEAAVKNELGDINLESPKQLLVALHRKGIYPIWHNKPSTDKRGLVNLRGHPIIKTLLHYRELETLLGSFVYPYLERNTEYVHPFFNQCGTRTGRPSCSNPNLLQIPKKTENGKLVRKMFIPREGLYLGDCDYGQIEPRVLAHLSKDPNMCRMFNEGVDFHDFTASNLSISRERAKVLNLSVGYRATWKSVSQQLQCGEREAQNEIDKWWSLFPTLRNYQDRLIWEARRIGRCVTLMGRRIRIDGLDSKNIWQKEAAERQCINNITQGSAAEVMKLGMINVERNRSNLSPLFGLLIQVYDQLVFESDNRYDNANDIRLVKEYMETCITLDVPLTVDAKMGPNWAEVKEI